MYFCFFPCLKLVIFLIVDCSTTKKIGYQCGIAHLRKILKELGFKWKKKTQINRELLMERSDIVANRIQFLRQMKKYREQGWTVVYTDETYVHTSHTVPKTWQSDDSSMKVPFSKGQRYIIVHAGTKAGFIQGAKLTFKAESETGDYYKEMNADNFFKWVRERLVPNLPAKSVVIIDNAPYHNIQIDKCPTTATRKADMQAWMNRHKIAFTADMFKPELLQLCRQNKPSPSYVLDNLLWEHVRT